jgi:hypothetical protein
MSLCFGVFELGMVVWSVSDGNAPEVNSYMFVYPDHAPYLPLMSEFRIPLCDPPSSPLAVAQSAWFEASLRHL